MTERELEQLEKNSIYTLRINDDLKDSVIQEYLSEMNKVVKREVKRKDVVVLVMEI